MSPTTLVSKTSAIAKSISQHLAAENGAGVSITLEIRATFSDGALEQVSQTVTEYARTVGVRTGPEKD